MKFLYMFLIASTAMAETWEISDYFVHPEGAVPSQFHVAKDHSIYVLGQDKADAKAGFWHVRVSKDNGKTWKDDDHFVANIASKYDYYLSAVTEDSQGNLLAAGSAEISGNENPVYDKVCLLRKRDAKTGKWETLLSGYLIHGLPCKLRGVAVLKNGHIVVAGSSKLVNGGWDKMITAVSANNGATWSIVDTVPQGPYDYTEATQVLTLESGEIWVLGGGYYNSLIRSSTDGGKSWSTKFVKASNDAWIRDSRVSISPMGQAFIKYNISPLKNSQSASEDDYTAVYMSRDLGVNWTSVDIFKSAKGSYTTAAEIAVSPKGAVAYCGSIFPLRANFQWYVRTSYDLGNSWETSDLMTGGSFENSHADCTAVTFNNRGVVFAAGSHATIKNIAWVIRKEREFSK